MPDELDAVARYAIALGLSVRPRTILVEGTTDAELFGLAARLEFEATNINLLGRDLAVVAAGDGDRGGTRGVIRELVCLRGLARTCLLANGRPRYRFIGLFDNDKAGKLAVRAAHEFDASILEFKDVFRLWPAMPQAGNLDPVSVQKVFERENARFKGLDWELEDLLPNEFISTFLAENAGAVLRNSCIEGKVHRELTRDGKARLHRFVREHAMCDDLRSVVDVLRALRVYMGLSAAPTHA